MSHLIVSGIFIPKWEMLLYLNSSRVFLLQPPKSHHYWKCSLEASHRSDGYACYAPSLRLPVCLAA